MCEPLLMGGGEGKSNDMRLFNKKKKKERIGIAELSVGAKLVDSELNPAFVSVEGKPPCI